MRIITTALLALTLAACTPPEQAGEPQTGEPSLPGVTLPIADRADNRMEALTQTGERWCTSDSVWCIENGAVTASFMPPGPDIALPGEGEIWGAIVRVGETALVGRVLINQQMYSGGSGSAEHLTLYEIANGEAREVLRMPYGADSMVRACFSEEDEASRAGACHDEYHFVSRISLDEGASSGAPVIILETAAGSYPGPVTRGEDSTERGPLTEADLVWARDDTCSFRRTYTRGADGLYAPDQQLPGCPDYLEP
jgi:hypothetical protein